MKLDYNELLEMVSEMGFRLMFSGAEIYRVEESISRLLQAYGAERGGLCHPQLYHRQPHLPHGGAHDSDPPDAQPRHRHLPAGAVQRPVPPAVPGDPPFEVALDSMREIERTHKVYSLPTQLAAHFLGCGMFSLFYGGSVWDGLCGGLCSMVICLCLALTSRLGANLFFKTIAGAAASAFVALALTAVGVGQNSDSIIIGALMALVPGIAFTNAMRDIMAGDMVAGISKAAEALLIGAAIALGTALALGLIRPLMGG